MAQPDYTRPLAAHPPGHEEAPAAVELPTARPRRVFGTRPLGWTVWLGAALVAAFVLLAAAAPVLAPNDPTALHPAQALAPPGPEFPLGTDNLGRCILSRLLYGSRYSLSTAALAAALITAVGVTLGALSGYYGGPLDSLLMRIVDVLLAFPSLVVALAIAGVLGPSIVHAMLGLVSVWWVGYARVVRGLVLTVRERPYVESARAIGVSDARTLWRHILPNVVPPVIVLATLEMGQLILAIAGLNFLGLGAQPPTPEWGAMLNEGRPFLQIAPQLMIYPGLAISLVVLGFNLLGDGLRDALDPRLRV
ncbi:MAG TPA: nickel transporter permease [Roseiflexaceae bacterium]|nr:nickel transporter permease [Roseiflexaceae bacterium]